MTTAKPLKRDVDRAHDEWAMAAQRSINADVDLAVSSAQWRFTQARDAWETATGRKYKR